MCHSKYWKVKEIKKKIEITLLYSQDNKTQFTVMTDRSQGGSSLQDGNLEVMVKSSKICWITSNEYILFQFFLASVMILFFFDSYIAVCCMMIIWELERLLTRQGLMGRAWQPEVCHPRERERQRQREKVLDYGTEIPVVEVITNPPLVVEVPGSFFFLSFREALFIFGHRTELWGPPQGHGTQAVHDPLSVILQLSAEAAGVESEVPHQCKILEQPLVLNDYSILLF